MDLSVPMKVSVVIAAYNAETFLRQTMESVLAQSLRDIEVIVVDDGSTDKTAEILHSFADPRLSVLRQKNTGVSAARNAGLAVARAPYIFFLDADDMLQSDALSKMVATLDRMPDRIACFGHHLRIAEDGTRLSKPQDLRWKLFPAEDTLRHMIAKNFIACGAICIRTEAARSVGGFNPALKLGEDWEFWCRLALLGDFVPMPDEIVLLYRQRFGSANYRLRTSLLRQSFQAIDAIYSNPAIRLRFSAAELNRRWRLAKIDAFWAGARNAYLHGDMTDVLRHFIVGAVRYPDSILRPRLVYLFLRGLRRPADRPLSGQAHP